MLENYITTASAESSQTIPMLASALRPGGYVMLRQQPCRIVDMSTTRTGKHGGDKVHITALDIFGDRKIEEHFMSTENVDVPLVTKQDYQLIDIDDDGFLIVLTRDGKTREDLRLPQNEAGRQIQFAFGEGDENITVSTIAAMGREEAIGWRKKK